MIINSNEDFNACYIFQVVAYSDHDVSCMLYLNKYSMLYANGKQSYKHSYVVPCTVYCTPRL